jgi:NAD(P) transhydrogenase subunit beta
MTVQTAASAAYIVAALLFILALAGLSRHETARFGNTFGIAGMAIALVATLVLAISGGFTALQVGLLIGAMAHRGGDRAVPGRPRADDRHARADRAVPQLRRPRRRLVGWNGYLEVEAEGGGGVDPALLGIHHAEVVIGVFIGAVTFTGSIVAWGKLSARFTSAPLVLPGKNFLNLGALVAFAALTVWFVIAPTLGVLIAVTVIALLLGVHLVASIGGGDMPVVVSMLNSYSGWAAAASGFLLGNDLLIITGALVGSSGAYLSYIMCKAMNRSFISVIAGGFGIEAPSGARRTTASTARSTPRPRRDPRGASSVIITPGYGMAVAQAQYPVAELTRRLRDKGVTVRFGIHPWPGGCPGT